MCSETSCEPRLRLKVKYLSLHQILLEQIEHKNVSDLNRLKVSNLLWNMINQFNERVKQLSKEVIENFTVDTVES